VEREGILFTNAGVRALVRDKSGESSVSRRHRIVDGGHNGEGKPGLVSVVGGKITGCRAIAEEVTDLLCRKLKNKARCGTARIPLPGASPGNAGGSLPPEMPPHIGEHLRMLYWSRASAVMELASTGRSLL